MYFIFLFSVHYRLQLEDDQGHGRGHADPLRLLRCRYTRIQLPVVLMPTLSTFARKNN